MSRFNRQKRRIKKALDEAGPRRMSQAVTNARTIHFNVLSSGEDLALAEVPTHAGYRYWVMRDGAAVKLDDGVIFGTYEEAAAVYMRMAIDDGGTSDDVSGVS